MFFQRLKEQITKNTDFDIGKVKKAHSLANLIHEKNDNKANIKTASALYQLGATEDIICMSLLRDVIECKKKPMNEVLIEKLREKVLKLIELFSEIKTHQDSFGYIRNDLTNLGYLEAVILEMVEKVHKLQVLHNFKQEKQKKVWDKTEQLLMPLFIKAFNAATPEKYLAILTNLIKKLEFELELVTNNKFKNSFKKTIKYKGWKEVKSVYHKVLEEAIQTGEDILAFERNEDFSLIKNNESFTRQYIKTRIENKVKAKVICPNTTADLKYKNEYESDYTNTKLIKNPVIGGLQTNVNIIGDIIVTFSLNPGQGTFRRNKAEADTWKSIFQALWTR